MMSSEHSDLGVILARLSAAIEQRRDADPAKSYTASLLAGGVARCAKKFGEEAVETVIAGAMGDNRSLAEEAADTLYHLMVLLAAAGVTTSDVAAALTRRENISGHDEKAARGQG